MNTKMYVGNLPFSSTEDAVRDLFTNFGDVTDVFLPVDRYTGRLRGFAFVTMATAGQMQEAITGVDSTDWNGRKLAVNEAQPKTAGAPGQTPNRMAKRLPW